MNISSKVQLGVTTVVLEGRLDTNTSGSLEMYFNRLFEEGCKEIALDMAKLKYISSAGLRVLLTAQKKVNAISGSLVIKNANATVLEIFDITGFSGILTVQ